MRPDISVVIPARNEGSKLAATIESIARARTTDARVEFVIVDDASTDGCIEKLKSAVPRLLEARNIDIRVFRSEQHGGIYRARNQAAALATADVLFITDAHVSFSSGWDRYVLENVRPDRIIAATTTEKGTGFHGYGCTLQVPFMGTRWNRQTVRDSTPVCVAACSATVIRRDLFYELGGYDTGMLFYGAGEPEFSVRAWLHGVEIVAGPGVEVEHEFKNKEQSEKFLASVRPYWHHNCIRFGLLYLSELGCLQLLRYFARTSPFCNRALRLIANSDVWARRETLERQRARSFQWFVNYFGLKNHAGGAIF